jgi:cell division FtsZ-interacting protein ZapD
MVQQGQPAHYNPSPIVKTEDLTMIFDKFVKMMVTALQQRQQFTPTIHSSTSDQDYLKNACNRCREVGHYVINCKRINRLIKEGKCWRSLEGRVILPGGAAILKNILG